MNKKDKKKWVKALRSGEYRQGQGQLINITSAGNVNYCCLGVACSIGITKPLKSGEEVVKKSFLSLVDQRQLVVMNDEQRMSFKQIADYIEKNL